MSHTHTSSCRYIEPRDITSLINNRNEPNIIREDVDVIVGRYSNRDLELYGNRIRTSPDEEARYGPFEANRIPHIEVQHP